MRDAECETRKEKICVYKDIETIKLGLGYPSIAEEKGGTWGQSAVV